MRSRAPKGLRGNAPDSLATDSLRSVTMPQLQTMSANPNEPIVAATPDHLVCPTCQGTMAIRQVMPSTSVIGVGETVYVCDACGTEAHRTARRP